MISAFQKVPEQLTEASSKVESDSAFKEGMRNIMIQTERSRESLFRDSFRNMVLDAEHNT